MTIVKTDGSAEYALLKKLEARAGEADKKVTAAVSAIIEDVRQNGDAAVRGYTAKFDGVDAPLCEITRDTLAQMAQACEQTVYAALQKAADSIADFHRRQLGQSFVVPGENGTLVGQRVRGLSRVGVYVPGGTAAYPSSVLMNIIPAKIAGVADIVMVTPPQKDGAQNAAVMAAAYIAGADRVFLCGGAQAVAALAYGTETVPKVDKIVGPGNIFVATAKRMVYGAVDIDMIAGPSEILVLADETANPAWLAADLLSQAEHDRLASAMLVTDCEPLAQQVAAEVQRQLALLPRREIAEASWRDFGAILVCRDMDEAVALANRLAPEHLEVACQDPMRFLGRLDNAGSVFLGQYAPEALGDYYAGPNHVLPTGGTARFFSPLSVDSFLKKSGFICYTREALAAVKDTVTTLADTEGLHAHARSVSIRFEKD